ncbi:hypothetical protein QUF79_13160 [Fictibacillus enclensis]|uniref:hypothetical protein n=1 Tax=Fictibacillus enclensis TaxID=1017270 RepID=UPI0025A13264|nr:hypothetical protein [Fictibacillus enclensis]MDM5198970.1 hypothetical protein [Fictibacillus enclensis]
MFFFGLFQQLPVKILTVALLIILMVYFIRKSIKLFFDKTSFLDEKREKTLMHFSNQVTKVLGLVFFFIYLLSHSSTWQSLSLVRSWWQVPWH